MTKIITCLLALTLVLTSACNNAKNNEEVIQVGDTAIAAKPITDTHNISKTPVQVQDDPKEEVRINYRDIIEFERYKVGFEKVSKYAPIDWESSPGARDFRTRISEAYQTGEVSFARYYVTSTFGCGLGCLMGCMIDVRDGKIYSLPLGEENSCLFAEARAIYNVESRLFIAGICKENPEDNKVSYTGFLWDEEKKKFEKVEPIAFLKNSAAAK